MPIVHGGIAQGRHANPDKDVLDTSSIDHHTDTSDATRDTVLTVAIGSRMSNGHVMPPYSFDQFRLEVQRCLEQYGTVVTAASGIGIGSDAGNAGVPEDTAVFIVVNPRDVMFGLRRDLAAILKRYFQTSACFAFDSHHEPAFATPDGYRRIDRPFG